MSELFKQLLHRRSRKSSDSIEELELEKSNLSNGYDVIGNGRPDISDGQINELAQTLGWSPDRLRELLRSGDVDYTSLRTVAHSTTTGFDVNGNGRTDITFGEVDQLANSFGFDSSDKKGGAYKGAYDAASFQAYAPTNNINLGPAGSSANFDPMRIPNLAHHNPVLGNQPVFHQSQSKAAELPKRGFFKNSLDKLRGSSSTPTHTSESAGLSTEAALANVNHFKPAELKTIFESEHFNTWAPDPKFFKKSELKGPLPKFIAAILKALTGGILRLLGFQRRYK